MREDIRMKVLDLLKTYPDNMRKIAQLNYELAHPSQISATEMLEAMAFKKGNGERHSVGEVSDKTLYIAMNYRNEAFRKNREVFKDYHIYDYKEEEIEKLENQLIRSISLLMLIARCLPNFEHRLKKAQKQAVIRAIYELPNKIFYAWAIETERQKDALIQMILQMETNEFTRKICTEDDAKRYLQRNSVSLLLELYYGTISNAYRENTYEYLTGMAAETVKFDSETYALEKLIVLLQSKRFASFYNEGKKVLKDTTSPAAELALYYIVQRLLMKETLSHSQAKRIESTFFMDKGHAAHLYRRQIENKDK